jgi:hypothetical protein
LGKDNLPSFQNFNANAAFRQTPVMRNEPRYIPTSLFLIYTRGKAAEGTAISKQNAFVETKKPLYNWRCWEFTRMMILVRSIACDS